MSDNRNALDNNTPPVSDDPVALGERAAEYTPPVLQKLGTLDELLAGAGSGTVDGAPNFGGGYG